MAAREEPKREEPYNPLDKKHLGESVADAMLSRPVTKLPPEERFIGAGVYAIYYTGDFPLYAPLVARNKAGQLTAPIYVGKAVPKGSRKGGAGLDAVVSTELHDRLREHAATIRATKNLNIDHFACRYLVVDDIWIPLGESLLIKMFTPVWNQVLDGFGIHTPGSGRAGRTSATLTAAARASRPRVSDAEDTQRAPSSPPSA